MNASDVTRVASSFQRGKIQRRQPRLQAHQHGQQARDATVAFAKWMDEDQFGVHEGKCGGKLRVRRRSKIQSLPIALSKSVGRGTKQPTTTPRRYSANRLS